MRAEDGKKSSGRQYPTKDKWKAVTLREGGDK